MEKRLLEDLAGLYRDLHANPELGFAEVRTAGIVADRLRGLGFEVTEGVGRTGVVGTLARGDGPTVLLRADMDALPVAEETGLPYASTARGQVDGKDVPVMHACGHDMHTAALLGALTVLAGQDDWSGRILAVFQPAEELGSGALEMLEDDFFARFGTPDVVLGQHTAPLPAGAIGLRAGPSFSASDAIEITLYGRGGHGSRPEVTIDPVVMAAAVIMRLQTVVSREIAGTDVAVLTIGAVHAGEAPNVIPDSATLQLSIRSYDPAVRDRMVAAIERIVRGEAAAAGAEREPRVEVLYSLPAVRNDKAAVARVGSAFAAELEGIMVADTGLVTGSEDVGQFSDAAGAPIVYWLLGSADPALFAGLTSMREISERVMSLPSNHSPQYAPVIEPTLSIGIRALVTAARGWLV